MYSIILENSHDRGQDKSFWNTSEIIYLKETAVSDQSTFRIFKYLPDINSDSKTRSSLYKATKWPSVSVSHFSEISQQTDDHRDGPALRNCGYLCWYLFPASVRDDVNPPPPPFFLGVACNEGLASSNRGQQHYCHSQSLVVAGTWAELEKLNTLGNQHFSLLKRTFMAHYELHLFPATHKIYFKTTFINTFTTFRALVSLSTLKSNDDAVDVQPVETNLWSHISNKQINEWVSEWVSLACHSSLEESSDRRWQRQYVQGRCGSSESWVRGEATSSRRGGPGSSCLRVCTL